MAWSVTDLTGFGTLSQQGSDSAGSAVGGGPLSSKSSSTLSASPFKDSWQACELWLAGVWVQQSLNVIGMCVCVCSPLPKINVEIVYRRQAAIENAQFRHTIVSIVPNYIHNGWCFSSSFCMLNSALLRTVVYWSLIFVHHRRPIGVHGRNHS